MKSSFYTFRIISLLEGISYILLLFIAMPLKHIGNNPIPVKIAGMAHGALFVAYCLFLLLAAQEKKWSIFFQVKALLISLIPFGAFYFDRKLKTLQ